MRKDPARSLKKPKSEKKEFYLNPIAILFLLAKQLVKVIIAGRGFGKSFLMGISVMKKVEQMPRSRGILVGPAYTQILLNIIPPMKSAWHFYGYKQWDGKDGDYIVGKKPPAHWDTPYLAPEKYENTISWWNGVIIILGSMDRPDLSLGSSNDWLMGDEVLKFDEHKFKQSIIPTVRGSHLALDGKPGHGSIELYSSMPYGVTGAWLLDYKLQAQNPDNDVFYIEGTSWHNRLILKDRVIKMWKRNMSPMKYLIEVLNVRIRQFGSVFYPSLKDLHWYHDTFDYKFIDTLGTDPEKLKPDCRWDKDYDPTKPLLVTHDFGAFNCILVAQEWDADPWFGNKNTVRFLNYMYVSHPHILQDLAKNFCDYYQFAVNKTVYQWGDKSGNKNEPNSIYSFFEEFANILEARGWRVIRMELGDVGHLARHKFLNDLHREQDPRLPIVRYNDNNCKDLKIALESTPMDGDKKDKRSEKNKLISQKHATHPTDAHDYFLWWGYKSRIQDTVYSSPVSFGGR